jgi:phage terminase large subunit GpA-like protein
MNDLQLNITKAQLAEMREYLADAIGKIPERTPKTLISEYAERRIMPPASPQPGPWLNSFTPYLVEPMDNMSPSSPIQREIILKSAQGGWTAMAENVLCFYMGELPADVLLMSAGDDVLERWATRRLEPAIDSFGIRDHLRIETANMKSRRSGDKVFSKDYHGCRLDMASSRSASKMRATDKRVLIRDEIDGVSAKLSTGEGYWLDVSWARTKFWGARRKVMDFGTPTTYDKSEIWKAYLMGDQRKFLVACPMCGTMQELEFGNEASQHGLKPVREAGELVDAVYICPHCRDAIYDHQKPELLSSGHWEPTTRTSNRFWRSRHWSSLYSPVMSFLELWQEYEEAMEKPDGMRSFTNLNLGLPFKETGTRLSATRLISLKSNYPRGTVPDGVLYTTVGVDVQQGSQKDDKNPPRLELEILGHGKGYRTWSIEYMRIEGAIDNAFEGAWAKLYEIGKERGLSFERKDGTLFTPRRIFIDSGFRAPTVYQFVERWRATYSCKGMGENYKDETDTKDKRTRDSDRRYKKGKGADGEPLFIVATNEYKRIMRAALKVQRRETGEQSPMFCEFPMDYENNYFKMLNAPELLEDGSFDSMGRRDEAAACRVYAMAAGESWLGDYLEEVRETYRKKGRSEAECKAIRKEHILKKLEQQVHIQLIDGVGSKTAEGERAG